MSQGTFALIPAAGAGARFGADVPKQYTEVAGATILEHAVRALLADERVEIVFVVLAPGDEHFNRIDWADDAARVAPLFCGGATRRASVHNGLVAASDTIEFDDWVLVHDAARPCLAGVDLARLITEASADPVGGLLAVPVADTLKRARPDGHVERTEQRAGLWQAQTPQMFPLGLLLRALESVERAGPEVAMAVTDEASAVESLGLAPRLIHGSSGNLKVTYPGDLIIAERLLGPT